MKLCSMFFSLCALCASSLCADAAGAAQIAQVREGQGAKRNAPNQSGYQDRYAPQGDSKPSFDSQNYIDGSVTVTLPNNRQYTFEVFQGDFRSSAEDLKQFKMALKRVPDGKVIKLEFSNGTVVQLARSQNGWDPIYPTNINPNDPVSILLTLILIWLFGLLF